MAARTRLVSSVLAARTSSTTTLAFKASVDELSRLAAARAQDELLLTQLEDQLHLLEPAVAARLLTECRFRDEWRDEQCARALENLPISRSSGGKGEHDPDAIARMQEYVAMLAPDPDEDGGDDAAPWQVELLRQQRAVASMLTLCTGESSDRVHSVLVDFMEHSRARLQEQLAYVNEQLAIVVAEQQQQQQQQGGVGSPFGGGGRRAAGGGPSSPSRLSNDGGGGGSTHTPRHAWGEAEDAEVENADAQRQEPPDGKGGRLRGMNADEFVAQLRGKHTAVCTLQAHARGRSGRKAFQRLVHLRLGAAVRLQCAVRQARARIAIRAQKHELWLDACRSLTQRSNARTLQRAWRWAHANRKWKAVWCEKSAKVAKREDKRWRSAIRASLMPRPNSPSGFSQFSVYTESKVIQSKREEETKAGVMLQRVARAAAARSALGRLRRAASVIEAAARGWHARKKLCWWRRALRALHGKRRASARWRASRATALALQPLQTHAVLVELHISKELRRVQGEASREKADFEVSFKKWATKMERLTLAKKLHADWIPQMNVEKGESYYFNVRTGESSEEHPNMRQVRACEKKQRQLAEGLMEERLQALQEYEELLVEAKATQLTAYAAHAAKVLADSAALRVPASAARWVQR